MTTVVFAGGPDGSHYGMEGSSPPEPQETTRDRGRALRGPRGYGAAGREAPAMNTQRSAIVERESGEVEAGAFLASMIEYSDDAIIGKTLDGIVLSWNKAAQEIFGYSAEEMIGRSLLVLIPPGRLAEERRILAAVRRGERVYHYETVRLRKDGVAIDVSVSVSPIRDHAGNIVAASKIVRDITDRKQAREKQELLDRTTLLLQQKEVLLEEMQHRVLNSLQIISSILLLKAQAATSKEARSQLEDAHHCVLSVASVQRHLHDAGHDGLVAVPQYLTELCQSLSDGMIGDSRRIKLVARVDGGDVDSVTATSLGLVVTELVINALKYAFPDKARAGEVLVSYDVTPSGWRLVIADNGRGYPTRAGSPTKGRGLGTRLIESLARQLDAQVETQTGPNGTSVSLAHAHPIVRSPELSATV